MRFELEIAVFVVEHDSDPIDAKMVVAWRYGLPFRETSIYFDAREGWRKPH